MKTNLDLDLGLYRALKRDAAALGMPWQRLAHERLLSTTAPMTAEEIVQAEDAVRAADMQGGPR